MSEEFNQYDPGGLTIEDLNSRLMALQSRLASTISEVRRGDGELSEQQSQIVQDIDSINLSVLNIQTTQEGQTADISSLSLRADGIELNVSSLDSRLGAAETSISQNAGEIALKASVAYVNGIDSRLISAESSISVQAGLISSKVSTTDFNGNNLVSMINQSSTTIDIIASRINLVGAVTVLSDLSGDLGTITAGNIDIDQGVKIGTFMWLGQGFADTDPKYIYFNNDGWIRTDDTSYQIYSTASLSLEAANGISFSGTSLNFNNIPVSGLNVTVAFG